MPGRAALILLCSNFKRFDTAVPLNVCAVNLSSFGRESHLRVHRDRAKSTNTFTFVCFLETRCEMYSTWPVQYWLLPYTVLYCYLLFLFVTVADSGRWRTSRHNSRDGSVDIETTLRAGESRYCGSTPAGIKDIWSFSETSRSAFVPTKPSI